MKNLVAAGTLAAIAVVLTFAVDRAEGMPDSQTSPAAKEQVTEGQTGQKVNPEWPTPLNVYRMMVAGLRESPAKNDAAVKSLMDSVLAEHLAVIADESACAAEVYKLATANRGDNDKLAKEATTALQAAAEHLAKDTATLRADSLKLAERLQELRKGQRQEMRDTKAP